MRAALVLLFLIQLTTAKTQDFKVANIRNHLGEVANDSFRLALLDSLAFGYSEINFDSSLLYAEEELKCSRRLHYRLGEASALMNQAYVMLNMANYPKALQLLLSAKEIAEDEENEKSLLPKKYLSYAGIDSSFSSPRNYRLQVLAWIQFNLGILYENTNNPKKAKYYYLQALDLGVQTKNRQVIGITNMNLGRLYLATDRPDSGLIFEKMAFELAIEAGLSDYNGAILLNLARAYFATGDMQQGTSYLRQALIACRRQLYTRGEIAAMLLFAEISLKENHLDSASFYSRSALQAAEALNSPDLLLRSYTAMADLQRKEGNNDSLVKYQDLIINIKDSLFNSGQARQFQNIEFDVAQRRLELEAAQKDYQNRLQKYILLGSLAIFLFVAIVLWRNNRQKNRVNRTLRRQKQTIENTLSELKNTQAQLIQSEKMASLGELTAGIAHEIQNPLNFVNNFSDINRELLLELDHEAQQGNLAEIRKIAAEVISNEEKINLHGKRAEGIVKNMLEHSRSGKGEIQPTDINALCEEFLKLSYLAFRTKYKSFNCELRTEFDKTLYKLNVVPQDIGRVLLNIFNNAMYACFERSRGVDEKDDDTLPGHYQPLVTVKTKKSINYVEIIVSDNGAGIAESVREKIFQPFFTTKPTGQGTGLGLSLSYDIVKAHGGEITAEPAIGAGTSFLIRLALDDKIATP